MKEQALVDVIQEKMLSQHKTLVLAESCTGGYVAHLLTQKSGASGYFLGSFVTYSDELKECVLGVQKKTLLQYGAVSKEVVCEMVEGIFHCTSADIALAISGIAGPDGGSMEKPIGTVWIARGERDQLLRSLCLHLQGSRQEIIERAARAALEHL